MSLEFGWGNKKMLTEPLEPLCFLRYRILKAVQQLIFIVTKVLHICTYKKRKFK